MTLERKRDIKVRNQNYILDDRIYILLHRVILSNAVILLRYLCPYGRKKTIQSILDTALGLGIAFSLWWIYFDSVDGSEVRAFYNKRKVGAYWVHSARCSY